MDGTGIVSKYKDWFFRWNLHRLLMDCESVLDLGCGECSPLSHIKGLYSIGVDVYRPSIVKSRKLKIHNRYIHCDLLSIGRKVKKNSFDAVLLLDVIEHFSKRDGLRLLKIAESVAKKKVVLLTPNGFYQQGTLSGNPYQVHKSGWSVYECRHLGYRVFGLRGLKYIRGEYATIYRKPWFFWAIFAFLSEPLLFLFPRFSYHLLAEKRMKYE